MISPRAYQDELRNQFYEAALIHRIILMVLATGGGKTVVCGSLILDYYQAKERSLFICALDCLIDQTADKLMALGIPESAIGYVKAGKPENRTAMVTIASLQTISRRKWFFNYLNDHWALVVWDEVHDIWNHVLARQLLDQMTTCAHLGLTGTPWRLSRSRSLHLQCDTMLAGPTIAELQEMGFLVKAVYYSLRNAQADTNGIRTIAGDWDLKELSARADNPDLLERMVENWQQLAPGQRTAVFTTSVLHSIHASDAFNRHGIPAAYVDGKTSPKERKRIYKALKDGEILVVCSCQVLSTGFDEPSISCGILARNSKSVSLIWQQLGRVFRISPDTGKTQATILDMAGVLSKIPVPESLTHYELQSPPDGAGGAGGSMKECPKAEETGCPGLSYGFSRFCSCCGAEFPSKDVDHDGSLSRLVIQQNDAAAKAEARLKKQLVTLRKRALKSGKDPGWANKSFFLETRTAPKAAWHLQACFPQPTEGDAQTYLLYLQKIRRRRGLDADWVEARMEEEFGTAIDWRAAVEEAGLISG